MGSIVEAMLRNGVYLYNNNGERLTIEDGCGWGNYMVARDSSGHVKYRIQNSELTNKILIFDADSGAQVSSLSLAM